MKFAAQVEFTKTGDTIAYEDGEVVSALYLLQNYMAGVEYDIFNPNILESEEVKFLPDGLYMAFMCGTIDKELDTSDDGTPPSYIFLADPEDIEIYRIVVAAGDNGNSEKPKFIQRRVQPDKEEGSDVPDSG